MVTALGLDSAIVRRLAQLFVARMATETCVCIRGSGASSITVGRSWPLFGLGIREVLVGLLLFYTRPRVESSPHQFSDACVAAGGVS